MREEKLLLRRIKRGDAEALRLVYERYKHDLLGLAVTLARDRALGEDVVHDIFVSFARFAPKLRLRTSLRSYLLTSVANRVRTLSRTRSNGPLPPENVPRRIAPATPEQDAMKHERTMLIEQAMRQLPYDQRAAIVLHLQVGMKFREIANSQNVSINTVRSRYRYGLDRLSSLLNGTVTP